MSMDRLKTIFKLASPMMVGMLAINLLLLIDTAMVGTQGTAALAALGVAIFMVDLGTAFFQGLAGGVQAIVARRFGEGGDAGVWPPLLAGLTYALLLGLPLSLLLIALAPSLFAIMVQDSTVWAEGIPYFRVVMASLVFQAFNFSFRGFFNGISKPSVYMVSLIVMLVVDVVLNYMFIFGNWGAPALGTMGAGIGTFGAVTAGTLWYLIVALRQRKVLGKAIRKLSPPWKDLLRLGMANGFAQFSFSAAYMTFLWFVARLGTQELAVANVLIRLLTLGYLPAVGIAWAAATLVGQSLGAKQADEANRWCWDVAKVAFLTMTLVGVPVLLFPDLVLGLFLHDAEALALARLPLQITALLLGIFAIAPVLTQSLMGAGDSKRTMIVSLTLQWLVFLPAAWFLGIQLFESLMGIWMVQCGYIALTAACLAMMWRGGRWREIEI